MNLDNYATKNRTTTTKNEPEPKRLECRPRRPESPQGKDFPNLSRDQIRIASDRHDSEATAADHRKTENENMSNINIKQ